MQKSLIAFSLILVLSTIVFPQQDAEGCKDPELFTRFPNFYIRNCAENFNELELSMSATVKETKEGNLTTIYYGFNFDTGEKMKSPLQIMKNYENAVVKNGGKMVFKNTSTDSDLEATYHLVSKDKEYWVKIDHFAGNGIDVEAFQLSVLEMEAMKQEIQANEMLEAINKDGFIALYINFETGKSDIKSESQPIVDQIIEMLKQNPDLKVSVEGHTDNVGSDKSNKTLSENRAKSVMNALINGGIEKSRLSSKGWGSTKPVGDNSTEDGRFKNRRVEIVKK
ncbi:MAG: OmpA family protein [Ignavibacteriales bacterium]|nr:OmpA family protein [Ignavibacteriales bacterium]